MATALFRRPRALCQCQRAFSTAAPRAVSLQWDKNDPEALADVLPPYPYGPTRWYKQSRLGLYGGQRIQFGNNVSGPFKARTRRTWKPNIFTRKLFSISLNRKVQVRVSARVLRTIDKLGGLDEYLLGEKPARIKELGESGWWLRWAIMQTPAVKKRFAEERVRLGLPEKNDDMELLTEATAELHVDEDGPVAEDMETVSMDDTFQIEHDDSLPTIKFRVGPRQHVMLTANGWKRTRPSPSYFNDKRKQQLAETHYPDFVDQQMKRFEQELDEHFRRERATLDNTLVKDGLAKYMVEYYRLKRRAFVKQENRKAAVQNAKRKAFIERHSVLDEHGTPTKESVERAMHRAPAEIKPPKALDGRITDGWISDLEPAEKAQLQVKLNREKERLEREASARFTSVSLDTNEREKLLKEARLALRRELQKLVDEKFERRQTVKDERTAERRALKQEKKATARMEQEATLELA